MASKVWDEITSQIWALYLTQFNISAIIGLLYVDQCYNLPFDGVTLCHIDQCTQHFWERLLINLVKQGQMIVLLVEVSAIFHETLSPAPLVCRAGISTEP